MAWCEQRCPLTFPVYCVTSGFVAMAAGAAASLLVSGQEARLAVWMAVTAVVGVAAGCLYPVG